MRRKNFQDVPCGIARAMGALGDAWSFVIVREAMFGVTAFDEFVERLKIPRNTLTSRLETLVELGVMSRSPDETDGRRSVYRLEEAGRDLWVVLLALQQWGNKWFFEDVGAPSFMADRRTKKAVADLKVRNEKGRELNLNDITIIPGPSAPPALRKRVKQIQAEIDG